MELKLRAVWRDGTTHMVLSSLEFMQRVVLLVPRPRPHLVRFHGVLAPNAKLRLLVGPQQPSVQAQAATGAAVTTGCEAEPVQAPPYRVSWARLLRRMLVIDMQRCPNCGSAQGRN